MDTILDLLLEHGSYLLMLVTLLVAGLGVPIPEDIVLISGGVLIQRGVTGIWQTAITLATGVIIGDLTIFLTGRLLGPAAYRLPWFAHLLPPHRRERLERLFARYGGGMVFVARHIVGLRAPMFALAGLHGMRIGTFLLFDLLALSVSGPLFVWLGYFFSERLGVLLAGVADAKLAVVAVVGGLVALALAQWGVKVLWRRWRGARLGAVPAQDAGPDGTPPAAGPAPDPTRRQSA